MEFKEVIKNRYSCKNYSNRQVEKSALEAVLSAGRLAPTAKDRKRHVVPQVDFVRLERDNAGGSQIVSGI